MKLFTSTGSLSHINYQSLVSEIREQYIFESAYLCNSSSILSIFMFSGPLAFFIISSLYRHLKYQYLFPNEYMSGSYRFIIMKGGSYYKPSSSWWYVQGGPRELNYRQMLLRVSPGFERNATVGFRCVKD